MPTVKIAAISPGTFPYWEATSLYSQGDLFVYNGFVCECFFEKKDRFGDIIPYGLISQEDIESVLNPLLEILNVLNTTGETHKELEENKISSISKHIYLEQGVVIAHVLKEDRLCNSKRWCQHLDEPMFYLWKSEEFKIKYFFKQAHIWADAMINLIQENEI